MLDGNYYLAAVRYRASVLGHKIAMRERAMSNFKGGKELLHCVYCSEKSDDMS